MIRLTKILPKEARFTLPERPSDRKISIPESSRIQVENDEESKRETSANIIQKMWKNRIILKWWNLMKKLQKDSLKNFILTHQYISKKIDSYRNEITKT